MIDSFLQWLGFSEPKPETACPRRPHIYLAARRPQKIPGIFNLCDGTKLGLPFSEALQVNANHAARALRQLVLCHLTQLELRECLPLDAASGAGSTRSPVNYLTIQETLALEDLKQILNGLADLLPHLGEPLSRLESGEVIRLAKNQSYHGTSFPFTVKLLCHKSLVTNQHEPPADEYAFSVVIETNSKKLIKQPTDIVAGQDYITTTSHAYRKQPIAQKIGQLFQAKPAWELNANGMIKPLSKITFHVEPQQRSKTRDKLMLIENALCMMDELFESPTPSSPLPVQHKPCGHWYEPAGKPVVTYFRKVMTGQSLQHTLDCQTLSKAQSACLFYEILLAVKQLHDHNIIHRNIQPNLFWVTKRNDTQWTAELVDLTFAHQRTLPRLSFGHISYAPPELFTALNQVGKNPETIDAEIALVKQSLDEAKQLLPVHFAETQQRAYLMRLKGTPFEHGVLAESSKAGDMWALGIIWLQLLTHLPAATLHEKLVEAKSVSQFCRQNQFTEAEQALAVGLLATDTNSRFTIAGALRRAQTAIAKSGVRYSWHLGYRL